MKKKKVWITIGVIVLIVALVGINVWKKQDKGSVTVATTALKSEDISESVLTPGTLKLDEEQSVYYQPENGDVAEIFVKEGDKVEKGENLLRYVNEQLSLEEKQTDLQLRAAQLELNSLVKQHSEIDKQIEDDPDNEVLEEEHDQIKLQQQQASMEVERSQLQIESIKKQLKELVVKSDIDGTVVDIDEHASFESNQSEQSPMIRIGSLNNLVVEGEISEFDTLKIKKDQPVIITSDAVPDEEWKGKVTFIADLPNESDSLGMENDTGVHYPIIVSVEDDDIPLKPGFQMLLDIETSKQEANTLPLNAVIQEDDHNFVYIVEAGQAVQKEVTIGTVTTDKIEITDGITKEDKVIKEPTEDIYDGLEVDVQ